MQDTTDTAATKDTISKAAFLKIVAELTPMIEQVDFFTCHLTPKDVLDVLRRRCEEQISDADLEHYLELM